MIYFYLQVYALNQPCKLQEVYPHHNNDPKNDKIPMLDFLNNKLKHVYVDC